MAERKMAAGGAWHKACFNCRECHKCLDSNSIRERDQDIYCNRKCSDFIYLKKKFTFFLHKSICGIHALLLYRTLHKKMVMEEKSPVLPIQYPFGNF